MTLSPLDLAHNDYLTEFGVKDKYSNGKENKKQESFQKVAHSSREDNSKADNDILKNVGSLNELL